jgi:hypothetical protein
MKNPSIALSVLFGCALLLAPLLMPQGLSQTVPELSTPINTPIEETTIRLEERIQKATAPLTQEYTFMGQANETIVVYERSLGGQEYAASFVLSDPAGNDVDQYSVSLAGTHPDEWAGRHALFTLPATGEYRLTFNVQSTVMQGAPKQGIDYLLRVRSSSAEDRMLLEATEFSHEQRYAEALAIYGTVIENNPTLVTAYIERSFMHLAIAQSTASYYPGDYSSAMLAHWYQALSPEQQALVLSDLRQISTLMSDALKQGQPTLDDAMNPTFFPFINDIVVFLESGEAGDYIKAFFGE